MKLIIDIPETPLYRDMYTAICENGYIYDEDNENIAKIIKDGTPLSEELKTIKAETIIDELEKIKAEITEYRRKNNCGVMECLNIIDKEIKGAWQSRWR